MDQTTIDRIEILRRKEDILVNKMNNLYMWNSLSADTQSSITKMLIDINMEIIELLNK